MDGRIDFPAQNLLSTFDRELSNLFTQRFARLHALLLRYQPGYDHSYYGISTFMEDHMGWHAQRLSRE